MSRTNQSKVWSRIAVQRILIFLKKPAMASFILLMLLVYQKETPLQAFSREFYEIFQNTFFKADFWTVASVFDVRER